MTISFKCSSCGKAYEVGNELAGKKGKCACGAVFLVPAGNAGAPAQQLGLSGQPGQVPMDGMSQQSGQMPMGGLPQQPGQMPMGGLPQQPGQMPMGGLPQQPVQMPMGGLPQQPGQMPMGSLSQQPGQMPMGGLPQQPGQMPMGGMPGQMPVGGNPYAGPAAMGQPNRQGGAVNTGIARASGHIHFYNALVVGGVSVLFFLLLLLGTLIAPSQRPTSPPSGFLEFVGRIMIIFTVIVAIVGWLAPLVSITAQWMFITVPSHAGKVLGIVAGSISSVCYLLFVIFALTGDGPSPALAYLMLLALMGWWVVHHLSLWKCAAAYSDQEGARSAIISCIVFPAGGIIFIILVVIIGAFADTALGIGSMRNPSSLVAAGKGIAILMILYMIAYASLTTLFYSKTMHSIRRCVR